MLITFEGKGCEFCPFLLFRYGATGVFYKTTYCNLELHGKIKFKENEVPAYDKRPKGCPFAEYPNILETQAQEG